MVNRTKSSRQAWLEQEILKMSREIEKLADVNFDLKEELSNLEVEPEVSRKPGKKTLRRSGCLGPDAITIGVEGEPVAEAKADTSAAIVSMKTGEAQYIVNATDELSKLHKTNSLSVAAGALRTAILKGSALNFGMPGRIATYTVAAACVVLTLVLLALTIDDVRHHKQVGLSEHHASGKQASPLMVSIAATLTSCGVMALICQVLQQPLILGYLLGGVLVGPIGLQIVESHVQIGELSSLGLIFLLFMIGLELDVKALLKMGKVVLLTGLMQFPICAGIQIMFFTALQAIGLSFGTGAYAAMYTGMVCGISSTMIVVKVLSEKGETGSEPGRLTIGILIFQDIWAIVVLAIQPNLASPEILGILKTFGMIGILIVVALMYAKVVMPAVLFYASKNFELMLILSLSWCFFIGCTAILPFVGLSMELAALIAGVALASFPYSAEFNGKIKYIRDFFITLFFAGLGMQIPMPSIGSILMGVVIAISVLLFRWLGIFLMVCLLGGGTKLGTLATLNLSQVSEFALVICSLGMGFKHINEDTMTIIIWTFAMLAISASYIIGYNQLIYDKAVLFAKRLRGIQDEHADNDGHDHDHGDHRDIVFLGYHKITFMTIAEVKAKSPQLLKQMHVVDFNQAIMPKLRQIGVTCSYGDISSADVLEHAFHGSPKIAICTVPNAALRGTTNEALVKVIKQVWPNCYTIMTADNPTQAHRLYKAGADYVIRMAKLCGERLHELLSSSKKECFGGGELDCLFQTFKQRDKALRSQATFIWGR